MPADKLNTQLAALFAEEVRERTSEMERMLLLLEKAGAPTARRDARARLLKIAHSLKGAAGLMEMRSIETACHRIEDLLAQIDEQEKDKVDRPLVDLLLATTDAIAQTGRMMEQGENAGDPLKPLLERLSAAAASGSSKAPGKDAEGKQPARPRKRRESTSSTVETSPGSGGQPVPSGASDDALRVPAERLDSLLYRSSELVLSRSRSRIRTQQVASLRSMANRLRKKSPERRDRWARLAVNEAAEAAAANAPAAEDWAALESGLRELARNLADDERLLNSAAASLDAEIYRARMQPFMQACQGLDRMVRDVSLSQGKSAELAVEGGGVEIDRSIVAALQDPLRHLVRNAIDHGIESPAARRAAGKPEQGLITVSASLVGDRVQVRVQDDGGGIDLASLGKRADWKGDGNAGSERELLRQVFLPGVSTSPSVTRLSGRGVGLDIVRTAVERLRGTAEVSHVPGGGTTFTLTLPLTLATFRALLISAGEQVLALDAACVRRLVRIAPEDISPLNGRRVLLREKRSIPVLDLEDWLGVAPRGGDGTSQTTAVILGSEGAEVAILIEQAAGEQELLARSLGPRLAQMRAYSGGAVLSDGRIAPILNAAALAEGAMETRQDAVAEPPEEERPGEGPRGGRRLLVVDDSHAVRELARLILERAGYEVAVAADGWEGWTRLLEHGADAIIADVDMPLMDGFALTQKIRDSEEFKNLPVILVTARETPEDKARGLHLGADAYLTKSGFDQRQLLDTVRQVV